MIENNLSVFVRRMWVNQAHSSGTKANVPPARWLSTLQIRYVNTVEPLITDTLINEHLQ
jgi:hypothetical protein